MRGFALLACVALAAPAWADPPGAVAVTLEIEFKFSQAGMERPTVFVDLHVPRKDGWFVFHTTAADYLRAQERRQPPNWQLVTANPLALPVGNYYFQIVTRGGSSTTVPVKIEKAGTVTLPYN